MSKAYYSKCYCPYDDMAGIRLDRKLEALMSTGSSWEEAKKWWISQQLILGLVRKRTAAKGFHRKH